MLPPKVERVASSHASDSSRETEVSLSPSSLDSSYHAK